MIAGRGPVRVGFGDAVRLALRGITDYQGRSSPSEFWWAFLAFLSANAVLMVGIMASAPSAGEDQYAESSGQGVFGALSGLLILCWLVVGLPLLVRRLHDTGKSGWWILIIWVPFGSLALLIFVGQASAAGRNRYGPGPRLPDGRRCGSAGAPRK